MRASSAPLLCLLAVLTACSPKQTTVPTKDAVGAEASAAGCTDVQNVPAPPAAAATLASAPAGAAAATHAECKSVDDCATSLFEEDACCPVLCHPRALSKRAASAQLKMQLQCQNLRACPQPLCREQPFRSALACEAGRCIMKRLAGSKESEP